MLQKSNAMIIFVILMLIINEVESSLKGNCSEYDSSGKEKSFCCNNHEDVNDTCIECANGFESLDGSPCRPCPSGFFGKGCIKSCDCNKLKCNHIQGCINSEENWTVEKTESTISLTNMASTREYNDNWLTTQLSTIITVYTISENKSTAITSTRRLQSTTPKPKAKDLDLNNREIIIYSIGGAAFVFCIIMCSVCKHRYKRINGSVKRYHTGSRHTIDITDNPQREVPLEDIAGLYEEIDESNMIDNMINLKENNDVSVTDSNGSYVQPESNNYLTPYQPPGEDANTNTSNDSKSGGSSESNDLPISDHESTSSKSDVIGERSSYLNPYQPIIHLADIHEYSSTHKIDDSSESDTQTMGSGYLNPYQPIVLDTDLHEYKSVLKCSDGLDSTISNACTNDMGNECPAPYQGMRSETDPDEYKSISNTKTTDIVSNILDTITNDSVEKFQVENDESSSYVQME